MKHMVVFYEKPGCMANAKQKKSLKAAGCRLEVRNLLEVPWSVPMLEPFLLGLPVAQWFNPNAVQIKEGHIDIYGLNREGALAMLVADPILIRRPLLEIGKEKVCGFMPDQIKKLIGCEVEKVPTDAQICIHPACDY